MMTLDRSVLAFAGFMVLLSVVLTVFVGANMLQSAFTGFCPAAMFFRKLGIRSGTAF